MTLAASCTRLRTSAAGQGYAETVKFAPDGRPGARPWQEAEVRANCSNSPYRYSVCSGIPTCSLLLAAPDRWTFKLPPFEICRSHRRRQSSQLDSTLSLQFATCPTHHRTNSPSPPSWRCIGNTPGWRRLCTTTAGRCANYSHPLPQPGVNEHSSESGASPQVYVEIEANQLFRVVTANSSSGSTYIAIVKVDGKVGECQNYAGGWRLLLHCTL